MTSRTLSIPLINGRFTVVRAADSCSPNPPISELKLFSTSDSICCWIWALNIEVMTGTNTSWCIELLSKEMSNTSMSKDAKPSLNCGIGSFSFCSTLKYSFRVAPSGPPKRIENRPDSVSSGKVFFLIEKIHIFQFCPDLA